MRTKWYSAIDAAFVAVNAIAADRDKHSSQLIVVCCMFFPRHCRIADIVTADIVLGVPPSTQESLVDC